ncbi:ABC transporter ATP-binding protein [Helicobacter ailurogastricus]|uniref:ABC transporter, ATP-binding protein n=1 Tax=Helicobacter ailurogastricus TaxID=1578720 RepID=A0A0K2X5C8_9HELI|nr:ATP-binding cassette domain-containing protein [Helicobacter ailurogastricus]CRF41652.1 ABC transporter, ATP-binding protein [Helicobacter ailurogastricus]CRF42643.1 ABC transporter, ATP-binding protein [Helicobacter ailurogastricus]CRF44885.1 ABC transporter, ATP-binding protein [Helicobacter ailurogastricus]CRF52705.1 Putative ABC transporter ATP binding protein [Helicobacter ailurogastricus]BDQ28166.1 ABC transporter ATP-binding protein [Helicobacter ailurogastricus]
MLEATHLSHKFDNWLYQDLHLHATPGESIALLGVSGSGKSSLLNNLSTMLKPLQGQVRLFKHPDIYALPLTTLLAIRRHDIGIIFQAHYLFRGFNALENLQVASILTSQPLNPKLLEQLGIAHTLKQQIGELSGGQQQRLSIARVLTKKPKIIFADEPTGNLDSATALAVMAVLQDYICQQQGVLILATHDEKIARGCTRTYLLENQTLRLL